MTDKEYADAFHDFSEATFENLLVDVDLLDFCSCFLGSDACEDLLLLGLINGGLNAVEFPEQIDELAEAVSCQKLGQPLFPHDVLLLGTGMNTVELQSHLRSHEL